MTKPEFIDTMGEIGLDLIDDALKRVREHSENIQMIDPERPSALSPKKRSNVFRYIASAAACLAVVCAIGLGVRRFGGSMTAPGGNFSDSVSEPAQSDNYSDSLSEPILDGQVTILGKNFYTFSGEVRLENMGITDEQLKEIVPLLKEIKPLKTLYLNGNQITDLSPLSSFTDLERLFLENNRISDISPLGGLSKLSILNMNGNNISDITPLEGCTGLTFIGLDNNTIADITPLKGLAELDVVNLKENRITDLSPLGGLDLTSLGLGSNIISDVSPLGKIAGLENLDLSSNNITDVKPLGSLAKLKTLDISDNKISDIDLKQLKESLPDCEIAWERSDNE